MAKFVSTALASILFFAVPTQAFPVRAVIRLNEKTPITQLVAAVTNPRSPRFRKFYTPEEIRTLSGPSDEEYSTLLANLKERQIKILSESKTRLFLAVEAEPDALKALALSKQNRVMESIHPSTLGRKMRPLHSFNGNNKEITPLSASDIRRSYGFDTLYASGLKGSGQHLAIATYDGFHPEDIRAYFEKSGISPPPKVDQVLFNGAPELHEASASETAIDAELSGMIAPGVEIHIFASAVNDDTGDVQMFNAILDDARAKVINYSWGMCESQVAKEHQIDMDQLFARALAQGVNILVASGDTGLDGCRNGSKIPSWPGSHPNVVSVGGTSLRTLSNPDRMETAWKGSGGGVSTLYDLPPYQDFFQTPFLKRSFPDVSFNADPKTGQPVWTHQKTGEGHWVISGGTSIAAPQWAGFLILLGEARAKAGKKDLGFLNPILYSMNTAAKAENFFDITEGSNGMDATLGWDPVTGHGSPKAQSLLDYLIIH